MTAPAVHCTARTRRPSRCVKVKVLRGGRPSPGPCWISWPLLVRLEGRNRTTAVHVQPIVGSRAMLPFHACDADGRVGVCLSGAMFSRQLAPSDHVALAMQRETWLVDVRTVFLRSRGPSSRLGLALMVGQVSQDVVAGVPRTCGEKHDHTCEVVRSPALLQYHQCLRV